MTLTKVLITVKTYPNLSKKYDELVCTAGILEDGTWIRIYPIPFRKLDYDQKYKKYQWIEADLEKNTSDYRPESYSIVNRLFTQIKPLDIIGTENNWQQRKNILFQNKIYTNLTELITDAKSDKCVSLATFKPTEIIKFTIEKDTNEYPEERIQTILGKRAQLSLFEEPKDFELVRKLPYKFSYQFKDEEGRISKLMIEDWEIGQLFWKYEDEELALKKVREQYEQNFIQNKDLYFFLGTTRKNHPKRSKNPFIIIGVFYPKKEFQQKLF
jgi:hypothetical protein